MGVLKTDVAVRNVHAAGHATVVATAAQERASRVALALQRCSKMDE